MKFTVYFEIYGVKKRVTVEAESEKAADYKVRCALKIRKVIPILADKDVLENLKDMFGMSG